MTEEQEKISKEFLTKYIVLCVKYGRYLFGDDSGMFVGEINSFDGIVSHYIELKETIV